VWIGGAPVLDRAASIDLRLRLPFLYVHARDELLHVERHLQLDGSAPRFLIRAIASPTTRLTSSCSAWPEEAAEHANARATQPILDERFAVRPLHHACRVDRGRVLRVRPWITSSTTATSATVRPIGPPCPA